MILYDLKCAKDHVFEAWFRDSATYDEQVKSGEVACPVCGSARVSKAPMAPNIAVRQDREPAEGSRTKVMDKLRELRAEVEKNSDHVGAKFPEEARKIHYGEVEPRSIHGDASPEQARELRDEGVKFSVIPWVPRNDS